MADLRVKQVYERLIDDWSRTWFVKDEITNLGEPTKKGDSIEVGTQSNPTNRTPSTRTAPEALTPTLSATLTVDQTVFFNVALEMDEAEQFLNGKWVEQTARQLMMRNIVTQDNAILDYLYDTTAYDTSATYHINVAADALTDNDLNEAEAAILSADGVFRENLMFICHPYGLASIRSIAGYVPAQQMAEAGRLGLPVVGSVNGIPVAVSNGVPRARTIAATASAIASNVWTLTVAAGHGVVPGQKITTSGGTADITTATAVTSVTATTIVLTFNACNDAANGALTITLESTCNLLVDRSRCFYVGQIMPKLRIVPDAESGKDALQVKSLYGYTALAGGVYVVNTPKSSV